MWLRAERSQRSGEASDSGAVRLWGEIVAELDVDVMEQRCLADGLGVVWFQTSRWPLCSSTSYRRWAILTGARAETGGGLPRAGQRPAVPGAEDRKNTRRPARI